MIGRGREQWYDMADRSNADAEGGRWSHGTQPVLTTAVAFITRVIYPVLKNRWVLKLDDLEGALSFRGGKKFQEKTELRLAVFLEMREGFKFTQLTVILFSFVNTHQKVNEEKKQLLLFFFYRYILYNPTPIQNFAGIFRPALAESNSFIWCQFRQVPASITPLIT